jgi:hypothetical protein
VIDFKPRAVFGEPDHMKSAQKRQIRSGSSAGLPCCKAEQYQLPDGPAWRATGVY